MRHVLFTASLTLIILLSPLGCGPQTAESTAGDTIDAIVGIGDNLLDDTSTASVSTDPTSSGTTSGSSVASGSVGDDYDYRLFEVGRAYAGDEWSISTAADMSVFSSYLVVLMDENHDLIHRQIVNARSPLAHIMRNDSEVLYLGVTAAYGRSGGDFSFQVSRTADVSIPPARRQVVYLNFDGGSDVQVHSRDGINFPAFDSGDVGALYAGDTAAMKAAIIEAMEEDYADYNLVIMTSDEGPPPTDEPYATLHFGGDDSRLLGLADSVDQYNEDRWECAIIYIGSFADFSVMDLPTDEMGQMIGNVASHELGHLLGLFHTKVPEDVMDTTGTAWDLAENQSFTRGALEQSVFPVGYENSPARLLETLGRGSGKSETAKAISQEKAIRKAALRALVRDEMPSRCGTCLHLDE